MHVLDPSSPGNGDQSNSVADRDVANGFTLRFERRSSELIVVLDGTVLHTFTGVNTSAMYAVAGAAGGHGFIATTSYSLL